MLHSFFQRHTHSSEKPFLCTVCGKTFARQHIRDVHERAHFGEKRVSACYIISLNERSESFGIFLQYPCSFCDKRFTTNQKKDIHERIHTGVKPYECRECGKRFVQQHQLQVRPVKGRVPSLHIFILVSFQTHNRIHSGERPYRCEHCNQLFRHLSTRAKHNCAGKVKIPPPASAPVVVGSNSGKLIETTGDGIEIYEEQQITADSLTRTILIS